MIDHDAAGHLSCQVLRVVQWRAASNALLGNLSRILERLIPPLPIRAESIWRASNRNTTQKICDQIFADSFAVDEIATRLFQCFFRDMSQICDTSSRNIARASNAIAVATDPPKRSRCCRGKRSRHVDLFAPMSIGDVHLGCRAAVRARRTLNPSCLTSFLL
jgi:hypothetical protein